MDITIVTAFYDLNKYEQRVDWRSKNNYLLWGEFVLKMPINIVFYVEHDMYSFIWKKKEKDIIYWIKH